MILCYNHGMYDIISTTGDTMKEFYIYGAELDGEYGFPILPQIKADFSGIHPTLFQFRNKDKDPKHGVCHFFTDDNHFTTMWNSADKNLKGLSYFKYVCAPDFSVYPTMPKAMQIWNIYRGRSLAYFMTQNGIDVIPVALWGDEQSFDWIFDGLPKYSTIATTTNGCCSIAGREFFRKGFYEMCKRLEPYNVLIIGGKIDIETDIPVVWMPGYKYGSVK